MDNQHDELGRAATVSTSTVTALRPLRADATLSPRSHTQRARVLATLHRIKSLSVSRPAKEEGHHQFYMYIVNVELESSEQSVLRPTSVAPGVAGRALITHSFREFTNLRRGLFYHADAGHRNDQVKKPCEFCAPVADFLSHSPSIPRTRNLLISSQESLRPQLDYFLNQLEAFAKKAKAHSPHWCEGQEMVPMLVKQFVLGDGGEEDLSNMDMGPYHIASFQGVGWGDFRADEFD